MEIVSYLNEKPWEILSEEERTDYRKKLSQRLSKTATELISNNNLEVQTESLERH